MGSIKYNGASVNSIYYGGTEIKEVYKGNTLIWTKQNTISLSSYTASRTASSGYIDITVTADIAWTASITSGSGWVALSTNSGSAGSTSVRVTYTENKYVYSPRTGVIHFIAGNTSLDMSFTQNGADPYLTVTNRTRQYDGDINDYWWIDVDTNPDLSWTPSSSKDWIWFDPNGYTGPKTDVKVWASANPTFGSRTATITVSAGDIISDPITIQQTGKTRSISISPDTLSSYTYNSITKNTITVTSNDTWTYSKDSWITVTDVGSASCKIGVSSYDEVTDRSGTVTFYQTASSGTSTSITVTQTAAPARLSLNSTATITGSTANREVYSNTSWTVTTSANWITVDTASGYKDATVKITVASATGPGQDTSGWVKFWIGSTLKETINVTRASVAYNISVNPTSVSPAYTAGSGSFTVSTNDSSWYVYNYSSGLTATKSNNTVNYTYDQNNDTGRLDRTVIVACTNSTDTRATFTIYQSAASISLSSNSVSLDGAINSSYSSIKVTSSGSWTASSNQTWLSVTSSGSNGAYPTFKALSANTGTSSRSATVTFACGGARATCTVTQSVESNLSLNSSTASVNAKGNSYDTIRITYNYAVTASSDKSWLHVTAPSGTSGTNSTLSYSCDENTSTSPRTGTITLTSGGKTVTLTVTQAKAIQLSVNVSTVYEDKSAGTCTAIILVSSNSDITVTSNSSWLTITTAMPLSGDGTDKQISYTYTANPYTTTRTAILTFTSGTGSDQKTASVSVVQAGEGSITITDTSNNQVVNGAITFAYTGGTKTYRVETSPGDWTVSTSTTWLTVAKDSSDTSLLNVTCGRYSLGRQGSFTITAGNNVKTVTITVNQTERDVIG